MGERLGQSIRETRASGAPSLTPGLGSGEFPPADEAARFVRFIPPTMLREGDYWTILYRGRLVRLRHNKGISYLAQLVSRPWETLHVSELYGKDRSPSSEVPGARPVESDRKAVTSRIRAAMTAIHACDHALGAHLAATITTGTYCGYSPRPDASIR